MPRFYLLLLSGLLCFAAVAAPRLPLIFSDNMVLQRNIPLPVWGWAQPGEKISVQFNHQLKKTRADKNGKWELRLDAESAGGPFELIVRGKTTLTCHNVLVGEVWICSGQSNMEFEVKNVINAGRETELAHYPDIRHIKVANAVSADPMPDIRDGAWKICSPETVGDFTAVGYFFARNLFEKLHVPVGLINTSWGGTMIETWISHRAFEEDPHFKEMIGSMKVLNLDSLASLRHQAVEKAIQTLQGSASSHPKGLQWAAADLNDATWPHMSLPGLWEEQHMGLEDLDGIVWFRRQVDIAEEDAGKAAVLELGKVDDSDDSYVNGTRVGGLKNQYNENRRYSVPAGVFKAGKNTIAVRVEDTGGGGGIWGDAADPTLRIGTHSFSLAGNWSFYVETIYSGASGTSPNSYPTLLFNAMIHPLVPFGIRGVLWYQGEANASRAFEYRRSFPLMISDWRKTWGLGDFPFYFVQLASFNAGNGNSQQGSTWAELREAQTLTLSLPHTGMAVTTDIGNPLDIHPKNKQEVGRRLAAIALQNIYETPGEYSGPVYQSMEIREDSILLNFSHVGSGLEIKDKYGYLHGFEISGEDQQWHFAKAEIRGNQVRVYQEGVSHPVAVHFGWADDASEANLFNKEGLPALPFRTDHWKEKTESEAYQIGK